MRNGLSIAWREFRDADILQIRFRITLNLNVIPFYPNKLINMSNDDAKQKITPKIIPKSAKTSKDKSEKRILTDTHESIEQKETLSEYICSTKLPQNEDL